MVDIGDISKRWWVTDCPCPYDKCSSALVEPSIVVYQGSISREAAEHIVDIHNTWLKEQKCPGCQGSGFLLNSFGVACGPCPDGCSDGYLIKREVTIG